MAMHVMVRCPSPTSTLLPLLLLLLSLIAVSLSFGPSHVNFFGRQAGARRTKPLPPCSSPFLAAAKRSDDDDGSETTEALEALQSLADFHEGRWKGKARSFTVTADVAAGIVQRKESPDYECFVKLNMDVPNRDFVLTESMQWGENDSNTKFSSRKVSLQNSHTDVDDVDASYSLDSMDPAQVKLPSDIIGTDIVPQFMIEHCIATSDDERARCFALYGDSAANDENDGDDGTNGGGGAKLVRLVVLQETRQFDVDDDDDDEPVSPSSSLEQLVGDGSQSPLTAADLLEMESEIDRLVDKISGQIPKEKDASEPQQQPQPAELDPLERLQKAVSSSNDSTTPQQVPPLDRHDVSLLELSSGVWLGDLIIRDQQVGAGSSRGSKGFGSSSSSASSSPSPRFAEWEMGVQKSTWQWKWNFGDDIRQDNNVGKAMGVGLAANAVPSISLSGFVAVNEGLSRRIPKSDRMVYIDWSGDNIGFLLENMSIQVPRYLNFKGVSSSSPRAASKAQRPFYTEFGVYQHGDAYRDTDASLPEVVCSKISRLYDPQGQMRQGCTSFYTLKRFGAEGDEDELR